MLYSALHDECAMNDHLFLAMEHITNMVFATSIKYMTHYKCQVC